MNDSSPGFEAELRVSPKPVIAALAVLGAGIILTINPLFDSSEQLRILLIGVLILVTTAVAWRFEGRKPLVGRWLTMILLVAMVYLSHIWLDVPGILTLMVIPTAMAAVLIGLSAATATAVGQTMLLLLLRVLANGRFGPAPFFVPGARPGTIAITLIAIWATFGVMYAVYNPVHRVARWSWDYCERAHGLLEEARDLEPLENELNEARLSLEELEMRRKIRDVSDEEYRLKMPALKWDIEHHEEGLRVKKAKITFLHDLNSVLSEDEIADLQEKAAKCNRMLDNEDDAWEASAKTIRKVKDALKDVQDCFESFGYSLAR